MLDDYIERIRAAHADATPLVLRGHGSKDFYGNAPVGEVLDTTALTGVVDYQPRELVLVARAGTPLAELDALLTGHGQMLAFEPPRFSPPPSRGEGWGGGAPTTGAIASIHAAVLPSPLRGGGAGGEGEAVHASASATNASPSPQPSPARGEGANDALRAPKPVDDGTLGGAIATGLSGPRRAYAGAARDFVLGVALIDGTGQPLKFGGKVIKNVAGYDVSRLMAGALGTLGLLTEIALKVLPRPAEELSLQFECDEASAIRRMNEWAGQPLPLSATSWHAGLLTVRLSGAHSAVHAAHARLGGEPLAHAGEFWTRLRDHSAAFFETRKKPLWRISVPSTAPAFSACRPELEADEWIEWGGSLRWIACDAPADRIRNATRQLGGHATRFSPSPLAQAGHAATCPPAGLVDCPAVTPAGQTESGAAPSPAQTGEGRGAGADPIHDAFAPLTPALAAIQRQLKQRFDPAGILNRGRLHPEF